MDALLQYGVLGVIAFVILQVGAPLLREYVLPAAREQRDREVRAIESLAASLARFGELLAAMDQRLAAVERDNEQTRADVAVLVERLPAARAAPTGSRRRKVDSVTV